MLAIKMPEVQERGQQGAKHQEEAGLDPCLGGVDGIWVCAKTRGVLGRRVYANRGMKEGRA